ncbi:hypothetical protein LTR17_021445 [Elasticomyces elasticus]|nr:hypothetical protein LTR17_021445 [Elasticomyces elasticus]
MAHSKATPEGVQDLLDTGYFSNFTIKAGDRTWAVHRNMVCTQSDFFMKACCGRFREATDKSIKLRDDPDAVDSMLQFFYRQTYKAPTSTADGTTSLGMHHILVYAIADKFDVQPLKGLAARRFRAFATSDCKQSVFGKYLTEIYQNGPETSMLKDIVVESAAKNAGDLFADEIKYNEYHVAASTLPEFAHKLCEALVEEHGKLAGKLTVLSETNTVLTERCAELGGKLAATERCYQCVHCGYSASFRMPGRGAWCHMCGSFWPAPAWIPMQGAADDTL